MGEGGPGTLPFLVLGVARDVDQLDQACLASLADPCSPLGLFIPVGQGGPPLPLTQLIPLQRVLKDKKGKGDPNTKLLHKSVHIREGNWGWRAG